MDSTKYRQCKIIKEYVFKDAFLDTKFDSEIVRGYFLCRLINVLQAAKQDFMAPFNVVAICYDFDKTLSPDDMQAQGYIQSVGYDVPEFWKKSNELAGNNDMDQNLAYMYTMVDAAEGYLVFTKEKLEEYGAAVRLFPGVEDWFERIRSFGKSRGVIVEHYIISSGLKEMIEGTSVARSGAFEKIYASSFYYNDRGVAKWPAQAINYTNKTQFLFRIEKGVLDINDQSVNDSFAPEDMRVPFRNMSSKLSEQRREKSSREEISQLPLFG